MEAVKGDNLNATIYASAKRCVCMHNISILINTNFLEIRYNNKAVLIFKTLRYKFNNFILKNQLDHNNFNCRKHGGKQKNN